MVRHPVMARFKMEDACILSNIIETFGPKQKSAVAMEMCSEGVEVDKWLGIPLWPDLRWKMLASFLTQLNFFNQKKNQDKRGGPSFLKLKMTFTQS